MPKYTDFKNLLYICINYKNMLKYNKFRYVYPPRPRNAVSPEDLNYYDNGDFLCQCKLNGSNCVIFTNGEDFFVMNRHKQRLTNFKITKEELSEIYRGDGEWMILNGEYLNKSKDDENGEVFNHKFVIFDILAYNGEYLIGSTFSERIQLLDEIYGKIDSDKDYLYSISDDVYRVKSYERDFKKIFDELTPIDMIEGLVMKRSNAKLELGATELNNVKSQLKCRKATKNYKY
jgi:ATP-dependent DNA ligase